MKLQTTTATAVSQSAGGWTDRRAGGRSVGRNSPAAEGSHGTVQRVGVHIHGHALRQVLRGNREAALAETRPTYNKHFKWEMKKRYGGSSALGLHLFPDAFPC